MNKHLYYKNAITEDELQKILDDKKYIVLYHGIHITTISDILRYFKNGYESDGTVSFRITVREVEYVPNKPQPIDGFEIIQNLITENDWDISLKQATSKDITSDLESLLESFRLKYNIPIKTEKIINTVSLKYYSIYLLVKNYLNGDDK